MPAADPTYESQARVYRKQGATAYVVASGGTLELQPGGIADFSSGQVRLPANLAKGVQSLDLMAGRILSSGENFFDIIVNTTGASLNASVGGMVHAGSVPKLNTLSTASKVHMITWASAQAQVLRPPIFVKPADFDSSGVVTVNIRTRAQQAGTNLGWQVDVWDNENATNIGTSTPALGTSAWTQQSITLPVGANLTGYPGTLAVSLSPKTHANDAMDITACWIEYARRSS